MRQLILFVAILGNFAGCKTNTATVQAPIKDSLRPTKYPAGGSESLFASVWAFAEADGVSVQSKAGTDGPHLTFSPGQIIRVTGFTGCNRLNGTVSISANNTMKFAPLAMTRKMCADTDAQEKAITSALQQVTNYYVVNDELLFVNGTRTVAKLRAQNRAVSADDDQMSDEQLRNLNDMLLQGVDFLASGNEPFWSLQIDRKKGMKFRIVSGDSINTPAVPAVRLQDVAASSYHAVTEKGNLTVIVYDQVCINDMSGHKLPKKVEITYNTKRYSGCGRYLADYRLNDVWMLVSINDVAIDAKRLKDRPRLEFNLQEQHVRGHSGCNGFGGRVEVMGHYMTMPRLTGTMMFCEDDGFEKRYNALLSPNELSYEIDSGMLTLYAGKDKLLFRKTD